jgi:hypothetical protein
MESELDDFIPTWLQVYLNTLGDSKRKDFLSKYEQAIHQTLDQLQNVPVNSVNDGAESGHLSVRLGKSNVFVNVKKSVWTALKYAGPLTLAAAVSPAVLAYLGITAAMVPHVTVGATASTIAALCGAFKKLSPSELDTYQAVAEAIERNRMRMLGNLGADFEDVKKSFALDRDLFPPKDLKAMLDQLVTKEVLKKEVLNVEQYFLVF